MSSGAMLGLALQGFAACLIAAGFYACLIAAVVGGAKKKKNKR
ncbi:MULTISPECIES: hypothetical protein [unclassified Sinorhizobium]